MLAQASAFISLLPTVLGAIPSCAVAGEGYDDPVVTSVNGGVGVLDSATCQAVCAKRLDCSVFTYYKSNGGCWLQGAGLTSKPMAGVVSGPRTCDQPPVPAPLPAQADMSPSPAPTPRFPAAAAGMDVAAEADMDPADAVTTPMPPRFIKAGDALYFAEGNTPRRVHLVRFHCVGCESACKNYIHVNPDYVASLEQDVDFNCDMLTTTTAPEPELQPLRVKHQDSHGWLWPLLICLLLCCVGGFLLACDQNWHRRARKDKDREGRHSERQPLTGSAVQGPPAALPEAVLGPGPPITGVAYLPPPEKKPPRLFAA
ncbi:unnamed protein product [Effrenium voratum]|uniref:Apple domain-containing protein n=1 Tax=Effrenium voratum TaxID=2562239 RepID=A0AA36HQA7_9DINO|nr:unnamed protein product [Effrenium voratum]